MSFQPANTLRMVTAQLRPVDRTKDIGMITRPNKQQETNIDIHTITHQHTYTCKKQWIDWVDISSKRLCCLVDGVRVMVCV